MAVDRPVRMGRIFAQVIGAAVVILLLVSLGMAYASKLVAEREAANDAATTTNLLSESVVQAALREGIVRRDPAAVSALDAVVRAHVLGHGVVRVKLWAPDGTILYSDEPRVVGERFVLGQEERDALLTATTHAEVSDLSKPENRFESAEGTLLEVYRPVWTPRGSPLLFEAYLSYDAVSARTTSLWRGFAGITLTSLLLLMALMLPILWRLLDRVRRAQDQRVALLEHAVDASDDERRRIAATLHDGVVQELAAASYVVAGAAERVSATGPSELSGLLRSASEAVRSTIGGLRSLLVDIYPPSLRAAGLAAALADLAGTVRTRDVEVVLALPPDARTGLDEDGERLVYRVAQESLRNALRHAAASKVEISLVVTDDVVTLRVEDDGRGFDAAATVRQPPEGHVGLQVMSDLATRSGAALDVCSAPGCGTAWRLTVPRP